MRRLERIEKRADGIYDMLVDYLSFQEPRPPFPQELYDLSKKDIPALLAVVQAAREVDEWRPRLPRSVSMDTYAKKLTAMYEALAPLLEEVPDADS